MLSYLGQPRRQQDLRKDVAGFRNALPKDLRAYSEPRRHDIGELCSRHGGGGHAVVGGITLRGDELPRARETLKLLVRELTAS